MVPLIMASMRNWLHGEDDGEQPSNSGHDSSKKVTKKEVDPSKRVVVVHCKAGKGRSGTMTCSYLISQCGWTAKDALARFTERRMRPSFGQGVSIPSQLRWVNYVDRWTKGGKRYVDREVEVVEVHVWGLRHGVKVSVEGFVDEGKKIRVFHTFNKSERIVVQGDAPGGGGLMDFVGDAFSPDIDAEEINEDADVTNAIDGDARKDEQRNPGNATATFTTAEQTKKSSRASILRQASAKKLASRPKSSTINPADFSSSSTSADVSATASNTSLPNPKRTNTMASNSEPGGMAVIFRPSTPVRLPTSDISVSLERRNRAPASMGLTMVTAVAHVWINTFFEGNGPEQDGRADDSGVFEIEWDKMDGIKGSLRKGTRAADKVSIVWRAVGGSKPSETPGVVVTEPGEGSPVPQLRPADWRGEDVEDPDKERRLGLRPAEPGSEAVSRASSVISQEVGSSGTGKKDGPDAQDSDSESLRAVKSAMPDDEDQGKQAQQTNTHAGAASSAPATDSHSPSLSEHEKKIEATKGQTDDPDKPSGAARSQEELEHKTNPTPGSHDAGVDSAQQTSDISSTSASLRKSQDEPAHSENQRSGDTSHLGFIKKGKKLLPMHTHKDDEPDSSSASQGRSGI